MSLADDLAPGADGLTQMRALLAGTRKPGIAESMHMELVEVDAGRAVFAGTPGPHAYNPIGSVHGGWVATLLDSCVGCAVHSTLPAGKAYTTAELKVNFVRAVTTRTPLLRAEGKVIHVGSRMATADGRLTGPDGKLYAHASTTCFIFDAS
jgi:uncharacterized protein (TIGR00369 family)